MACILLNGVNGRNHGGLILRCTDREEKMVTSTTQPWSRTLFNDCRKKNQMGTFVLCFFFIFSNKSNIACGILL